ncbi:hypothetical protein GOHSU_16_00405 [Gordonia hirsuta DSM 44140 = NBRC 16056]|uniref:Uncharacterized protein n=1 Tax=Gordonia hirsuta DSM 44140 = NBRC 16056 TaxID=1121927 RepID=L7L850_9ACTN|nr:hypothetical protein GOHSU_16_00405 [Gordonia hirsuta DSM 44140 = NBRC 16056]
MQFEVVVDRTERVQKCTILPLAYRDDFEIRRVRRGAPVEPLTGDLLLHPDGESLATLGPRLIAAGPVGRLSAIDCIWKQLDGFLSCIGRPLPQPAAIPPGFVTAYPRKNKVDLDPDGGLATIEALFIAAAFLGVWDETLLAEYYFGPAFLEANREVFARYGLGPDAPEPADRARRSGLIPERRRAAGEVDRRTAGQQPRRLGIAAQDPLQRRRVR